MDIVAVAIEKGGIGKTTTAAMLANAGTYRGRRVLAIDLDPQGQFGFTLGADTSGRGAYELLRGTKDPTGTMQEVRPGLWVIPTRRDIATLPAGKGAARRLQKALADLPIEDKGIDLIVIDTPPTSGILQYTALQTATRLVIPIEADIYALQSLHAITDTARQIQHTNPALQLSGIIITKFDGRGTLSRQMRETIIKDAAELGLPCLGTVRMGIAVKEAAFMQESIFTYAPKSKPAGDYLQVYENLFN